MRLTGASVSGLLVLVGSGFVVSSASAVDSAYTFVDNVVSVEAEALQYNSLWQRRTDKSGFTGSAWLQYVGPERHGDESTGEHDDPDGRYQGGPADWLTVPVYVTQVGVYYVQIHAFHTMYCCDFVNGDATVWTHAVDYPYPVHFSHGETAGGANSFTFMGYGPLCYNGEEDVVVEHAPFVIQDVPRVVTFYVSGRDRNFGVDRIHIYRRTGPNTLDRACYPVNADNKLAPLSTKTAVPATGVRAGPRLEAAPQARPTGLVIVAGESPSGTAAGARQLFDLRGSVAAVRGPVSAMARGCMVAR